MPYSQQYDNLAQQIAREVFGDSPLAGVFYRMMKQESGFDSDVVEGRRASSAGAQGIAQFMPGTAQEQGVNPLNPEEALRGGAAYLQKLIAYFGGDVAKGVAAYNAGAGRVEKAVAAGGTNWTGYLPAETQSYLQITQPEGATAMPNGTIETAGVPVSPWERDLGVGAAPPTPTAGATSGLSLGAWIEQQGYVEADPPEWGGAAGGAGLDWYGSQPSSVKEMIFNEWRTATGQPTDAALTPEEQEQQRLKTAGEEIDLGLWPYSISQDEFDNTRQWYLDQVAAGQQSRKEAVDGFYAWLAGTQEATKRAESLMEREQRTLPQAEFPLTEQGGMLSQIAEGYDLPWTPWKGVPIEEMTSPEAAFSRFQQGMGLSQQAPEMAPYDPGPVMEQYGQAVGAQSQGAQAAIDWIRGMLQKRGVPST